MTKKVLKIEDKTYPARTVKLKTAVAGYLFLVFFVVGLLVVALLKFHAFSTLEKSERHSLQRKNIQIIRIVQNELERLTAFAVDWSRWNETYWFMQDKNPVYIESNFSEGTLDNIGTMGFLYLDLNFKKFYSFTYADRRNDYDQVISQIEQKKDLFLEALTSSQGQVLLFNPTLKRHYWSIIRPTLPGSSSPLHNGYLILTIEMNDQFYNKLSSLFGSDILPTKKNLSTAYECLESEGSGQFCQRVILVDDSQALLEVAIEDSENKEPISLQTKTDRELNQQIKAVFTNTLAVLLASGLLIILLNLFILNKLIIRPVSYLSLKFTAFAQKKSLHRRLQEFGPTEMRKLTSSANLMLSELEVLHRKVEHLSHTDELTGVYNRRYFHDMFKRDKAHAIRAKEYIAVLLLDLDFFKQYNDIYGHVSGDKCLQTFARILKDNVKRNTDVIARYGGEEFIILLSDTPLPCVQSICKRILKALEATSIPHTGSSIATHVTCSIGGIAVIPTLETTEENLILRADKLLYKAKEEGRNRYILSDRL